MANNQNLTPLTPEVFKTVTKCLIKICGYPKLREYFGATTNQCFDNWVSGHSTPSGERRKKWEELGYDTPRNKRDIDSSETVLVSELHSIDLTDEELDIVASAMDSMFYEPNSFYTTKLMISVYDKLMKAGWDPNKLSKEIEAERRFWDEQMADKK